MTPPNYGKIRQAKGKETNRNWVIKQQKTKMVNAGKKWVEWAEKAAQ